MQCCEQKANLHSNKQIRKQKWVICIPLLHSENTPHNSQCRSARLALPWEMTFQPSMVNAEAPGRRRREQVTMLLLRLTITAQMQGRGDQQVMPHLAWAAASSRSCSCVPRETAWLAQWLLQWPPPALPGWSWSPKGQFSVNPSRFQTAKAGKLNVRGDLRLEECLPASKGRQLPRGELQFLQELLGSN